MVIKGETKEIKQQSTTNKPNQYSLCVWGVGTEVECKAAIEKILEIKNTRLADEFQPSVEMFFDWETQEKIDSRGE